MPRIRSSLIALLLIAAAAPAIAATPSTSKGQISVAQVMEMLDRAGTDKQAGQLLYAYLGGVGESAGVLLNATDAKGKPYVTCSKPMGLTNGAPNNKSWGETAATPLLVNALVSLAGCR